MDLETTFEMKRGTAVKKGTPPQLCHHCYFTNKNKKVNLVATSGKPLLKGLH